MSFNVLDDDMGFILLILRLYQQQQYQILNAVKISIVQEYIDRTVKCEPCSGYFQIGLLLHSRICCFLKLNIFCSVILLLSSAPYIQIGQGTYSSVFRARDLETGKIVALKKVRFDNFEPESVRFMAREILILRRLDHPNIIKLEGIVASKLSCSIYLVFEYMEHDLAGLVSCPDIKFTEAQVCSVSFLTCYYNFIWKKLFLLRKIWHWLVFGVFKQCKNKTTPIFVSCDCFSFFLN